ncbi:hypothetical protein YpEc11_02 [Yersinia phage vB_YpEc11]|uniref:Uncharacterized protein n=1 Tax=Yersinia phage vB_YpEc11 TaxID=3056113 RepID=A0AA51Z2X9_9CAUD|nr:hypothetical protein YpEc11_02 [Yersinia phage vB_YpEc11]
MTKVYGITQETLQTYRSVLAYGCSFESTMQRLKDIYQHNKEFALNVNPPDFSNICGHPAYVSQAGSERTQANQG